MIKTRCVIDAIASMKMVREHLAAKTPEKAVVL